MSSVYLKKKKKKKKQVSKASNLNTAGFRMNRTEPPHRFLSSAMVCVLETKRQTWTEAKLVLSLQLNHKNGRTQYKNTAEEEKGSVMTCPWRSNIRSEAFNHALR